MKNNDIMDIQHFLDLLDSPTKGSVAERSIAITVLKRTFTHLQTLKKDLTCEINQLTPDENSPHGWRGVATKDEFYDCAKGGYCKGVALVIRQADDGAPVRAVALVMSADLTEELFGTSSYTVTLTQLDEVKPVAEVKTSEPAPKPATPAAAPAAPAKQETKVEPKAPATPTVASVATTATTPPATTPTTTPAGK